MKKRNLTLALVAVMVAGAGLTACSSDPLKASKTGAILTISGANNLSVNVEDIFSKYLLKSSGISAYYDALCEAVIRSEIEVTDEIADKATASVNAKKEEAKDMAHSNGTSYDDALDDILEGENVEDLDELYDKYVYSELKEKSEKDYLKNHAQELLTDYIDQMVPYHISHILVKVSASANDGGYSAQITAQEARNLGAAISMIAQGRLSFGTIAQKMSEDGSATSYGELGIMDTSTNYVPEFKLGLYAYDRFFNHTEAKDAARLARLNVTPAAEAYYASHAMTKIDFDKVLEMASDDVANKTTDDKGRLVNEGDADFYPRNIYFNHLFNSHQIGLVTTTKADAGANFRSKVEVPELADVLADNEYALCTEDMKPIIVVRSGSGDSYQGVHFIAVNKDPITNTLDALKEYYDYTQTIPTYSEAANTGKYFVSFHANTNKVYNSAIDKLKSSVEGFDKMIDSRIFKFYLETEVNGQKKYQINPEIKVKSESGIELTLAEAIYNYMDNTKAANEENTIESLEQSWNEYIEQMEVIDFNRKGYRNATNPNDLGRMVSFTCASTFKNASTSDDYKEGGLCYAKK